MAQLNVSGNGKSKKGKPTKMNLRVDFTPMVDMNMLLITFFMFCTTLSTPKIMDIVVPTKATPEIEGTQVPESKSLTLILGEEDKVYYYHGKPDYESNSFLQVTNYQASGLRSILLEKNSLLVNKSRELKQNKVKGVMNDSEFAEAMKELKKSKEGAVVLIKPSDVSTYKNLVDVLDEMQVCNVNQYAIMELEEGDRFLLDNYPHKVELLTEVR